MFMCFQIGTVTYLSEHGAPTVALEVMPLPGAGKVRAVGVHGTCYFWGGLPRKKKAG